MRHSKGGGNKAHAWVNGPQPWHPQYGASGKDGQHSTAPKDVIQKIANKSKQLWINPTAPERRKLIPPEERQAHPRLTPAQLTSAGRASAPFKAIAFDGIHPRHIGNLSTQGQAVVAAIWEACELASCYPPQISDVQAPLIPKKRVGCVTLASSQGASAPA